MPCFHPWKAWRHVDTGLCRRSEPPEGPFRGKFEALELPCGKCVGCLTRRAREWSIRATYELLDHTTASWVTLTYSQEFCPPALMRTDLAAYLKRLRSRLSERRVRFFACGEYGEKNSRPHYHAIIYGVEPSNSHLWRSWGMGRVQVDEVTVANVAYTAGYTTKKLGDESRSPWVRDGTKPVCDEDGVYLGDRPAWKRRDDAPFLAMSKSPGLGASRRAKFGNYVESIAWQGREFPVPRYYRDAVEAGLSGFYTDDSGQSVFDESALHYYAQKRRAKRREWTPDERQVSEAVATARLNLSRGAKAL